MQRWLQLGTEIARLHVDCWKSGSCWASSCRYSAALDLDGSIKGWTACSSEPFNSPSFARQIGRSETSCAHEVGLFRRRPRSSPQVGRRDVRQNCESADPAVGLSPLTLQRASLRLAPVQINGSSTSFRLADTRLLRILYTASSPRDAQDHYSERLVSCRTWATACSR